MIHIIDDFYPNPDEVREQALEMFYYPGVRGDRVFFLIHTTIEYL